MIAAALSLAVIAAAFSPSDSKQHVFNKDLDEFIFAVNEAVQLMGLNYLDVGSIKVIVEDSLFDGIRVGDLSTWKRLTNGTITGGGLQTFNVSADVGLDTLHFRVDKFSTASYKGALSVMVLNNSAHLEFQVQNRFQPTCRVTLTSLSLNNFEDPRYYSDDLLASGFTLEKDYILDFFRESFFSVPQLAQYKFMTTRYLQYFFCKTPLLTVGRSVAQMLNSGS
ncbi:hypothetical protein AAG570_011714 [Ranatra chinensis]|uniref:Uncharacterized protein n=1 Tax=Ranatra chinensis TaxID=642074 RepID=A0ABD0YGM6_9HEMI